jgi:N-acetylmuramoyl-L-alanine amidase
MIRKAFYLLSLGLCGVVMMRPALAAGLRADHLRGLNVATWGQQAQAKLDLARYTPYRYFTLTDPDRAVVDLRGTRAGPALQLPRVHGWLEDVRMGLQPNGALRLVFTTRSAAAMHFSWRRSAAGQRLLVRLSALGAPWHAKKTVATLQGRDIIITVDPGHGGIDPGTIGIDGIEEKNITLAIGRRLARLIDAQRGMLATMTRDADVYVPLRERMHIAARDHANLFVSIHVNDCSDPHIKGAEVYILSLHGASNEAARLVAERENAADRFGGMNLRGTSHTLASVLVGLSQAATISRSMVAARSVLTALEQAPYVPVWTRSVLQAPFVVLKSPTIPSMLIETDFMSDPSQALRLTQPWFQQSIAAAIFRGILAYFRSHPPAGTLFAAERAARLRQMVASNAG